MVAKSRFVFEQAKPEPRSAPPIALSCLFPSHPSQPRPRALYKLKPPTKNSKQQLLPTARDPQAGTIIIITILLTSVSQQRKNIKKKLEAPAYARHPVSASSGAGRGGLTATATTHACNHKLTVIVCSPACKLIDLVTQPS
jgi:hypothetical protein